MQPFGTILLLLLSSAALVLLGHVFRLLRWEQFIRIYEYPQRRSLLRAMAGGYAVNFLLPFHVGDFSARRSGWPQNENRNRLCFLPLSSWIAFWMCGWWRCCSAGSGWPGWAALRFWARRGIIWFLHCCWPPPWCWWCCCGTCSSGVAWPCAAFSMIPSSWTALCSAGVSSIPSRICAASTCGGCCSIRFSCGGAYLASYAVLGQAIIACGGAGGSFGLVEVFNMLFGVKSVDVTSLGVAGSLGLSDAARGLVIAWFLLPLAVMFAAPLLPEHLRAALNGAAEPIANREAGQENYLNLLPQVDPRDRGAFLNQYFSLQNKAYVAKFIEINQNITILQDYSAGSNATTMLCTDGAATFYRKYAFGADGAKLAEQLAWLRRNAARLPLCEILREGTGEGYCWYDMTYSGSAVGLFRYIHSNPPGKSAAILRSVLRALDEQLYRPTARPADPEKIEEYLKKRWMPIWKRSGTPAS